MGIFYITKLNIWQLLLILTISPAILLCSCPFQCTCVSQKIDCQGADLTEVPQNINKSVKYVDLSNNPFMRVERETFLNFTQLHTLILNNCGLSHPIDLPSSLQKLSLIDNRITRDSLKAVLSNNMVPLKFLDIQGNGLNLTSTLPYMPKSIEYIDLSRNDLQVLKRRDLCHCKRLKVIACKNCRLQQVESNAFDYNNELYKVELSRNELIDLPDDLFEYNNKLAYLILKFNQIENINSSKLKIKHLHVLELGFNKLRTFDLRHTQTLEIGLESNMISRLDDKAFGQNRFIHVLRLHNNNIDTISQGAFQGVQFISELLLYANNLTHVPVHIFKNVVITKLFLHKNQLSNLNGLLLGMRRAPMLLTLFLNKKLKFLNISNFESMSSHSELFITCKNLKGITGSSKLRTSVKCSPSADLTFHSQIHFWAYDGYECHWNDDAMQFLCRACPVGSYSNGSARTEQAGMCIKCPPGSFYQDELASLSCKTCPVGQFVPPDRSPGKDASDCQTCPKGTNTNISAGTRACVCLKGFYRFSRFGSCEKCRDDGFECLQDFPQLNKGYWLTWNGTGSTEKSCKESFKNFVQNLQTFDNSYDRNTINFSCHLPTPVKCPMHGSCSGGINVSCSSGYTGALCAVCSRGYSRQFNRCVKCPHSLIVILEIIGYFTVFFILCLIISLTDKIFVTNSTENEQKNSFERRTFADVIVSSFKILVGFYQVLISVMSVFSNISWPESIKQTIFWLEYIQFEVIKIPSLRCIDPEWEIDSLKEFWITVALTFALPALSLIYFLLKLCYFYVRKVECLEFRRSRDICGKNCLKVNALFLFATYPLASTKIIQILPLACHSFCTVKQNGICLHSLSFLRSDYSLPCSVLKNHKYTMIAAYCSLIIPFGLPIVLLVLLWRYAPTTRLSSNSMHVSSNNPDTMDIIDLDGSNVPFSINSEYCLHPALHDEEEEEDNVALQALKFAYENYDKRCWYWEVLEMIRKLIMTVGVVVLFNQTNLGLFIIVIIAIAFAFLHALKKPIKNKFENAVQLLSLLIVPLNLTTGAILESNAVKKFGYNVEGHSQAGSFGLIFVIMNSLVVILIIGRFLNAACRKLLHLRLKKRQ